jgi:hypothetical protein
LAALVDSNQLHPAAKTEIRAAIVTTWAKALFMLFLLEKSHEAGLAGQDRLP